jgi:AraC family transcriptional regulator of adaptative response/methylated-DNA-[protein]-cysteine methyltransferase
MALTSGPVVGVKTTRIYCRPTCEPPRPPRPENRIPFPDAATARAAGFRACKLCRPDEVAETVRYGRVPTSIGPAFAAATEAGLAALLFLDGDDPAPALDRLDSILPAHCAVEDASTVERLVSPVGAWLDGGPWPSAVPLDLRGTEFQLRVWEALREIPEGETRSYGTLAAAIGRPTASRAVGAACGANPVAILVPCHRAIGSGGSLVNYRWGLERKRALLERERRSPALLF